MAITATAAALAAATIPAGVPAAGGDSAFRCPVSSPTARPLPARPAFDFGNTRIAVDLPQAATFVAVQEGEPGGAWVQRDGTIRAKVGWWRSRGPLRVRGRRLDRPTRPLRTDVGPLSWTSSGEFVPSLLYFSSAGCWRITATAGGARLQAVVRVVRR